MSKKITSIQAKYLEKEAKIFEEWYQTIECDFSVVDLSLSEQAAYVSGVENRNLPIHRWYNLKEAFSARLPTWVLDHITSQYATRINQVLDPFSGSGTTGISLAQRGLSVTGTEYNPFIHFVASTKAQYPNLRKELVNKAIGSISLSLPKIEFDLPLLSTFSNPNYFRLQDLQILLSVKQQIQSLDTNDETKAFLLLGLAATIDDVANLRKDGRALRHSPKPNRLTADEAIRTRWRIMEEDIEQHSYPGNFQVHQGSAVNLQQILVEAQSFDLVLYSPPYLNNFDYSEIYKLETWLLGFLQSYEAWRDLRLSTIRSHPSIKFFETRHLAQNPRTLGIFETLDKMVHSDCLSDKIMINIILGYFDDMYLALQAQWAVLKSGGFLVYVVANSRHHWLPIATDVILGEIAKAVGFKPLELIILKHRNGRTRQKTYLRETTVIMQKP